MCRARPTRRMPPPRSTPTAAAPRRAGRPGDSRPSDAPRTVRRPDPRSVPPGKSPRPQACSSWRLLARDSSLASRADSRRPGSPCSRRRTEDPGEHRIPASIVSPVAARRRDPPAEDQAASGIVKQDMSGRGDPEPTGFFAPRVGPDRQSRASPQGRPRCPTSLQARGQGRAGGAPPGPRPDRRNGSRGTPVPPGSLASTGSGDAGRSGGSVRDHRGGSGSPTAIGPAQPRHRPAGTRSPPARASPRRRQAPRFPGGPRDGTSYVGCRDTYRLSSCGFLGAVSSPLEETIAIDSLHAGTDLRGGRCDGTSMRDERLSGVRANPCRSRSRGNIGQLPARSRMSSATALRDGSLRRLRPGNRSQPRQSIGITGRRMPT